MNSVHFILNTNIANTCDNSLSGGNRCTVSTYSDFKIFSYKIGEGVSGTNMYYTQGEVGEARRGGMLLSCPCYIILSLQSAAWQFVGEVYAH